MKTTLTKISGQCAAALLAAALCSSLHAQNTDTTPTPTPTQSMDSANPTPTPSTGMGTDTGDNMKVDHADRAFLKKAAKGGMKEVAVSQAVMDHLTNDQVKSFAQMMVTDHTAANNELMDLASRKGVQLPAQNSSETDDWSKKTGDVDRKYIKEMVSDHESTVKLFEKGSKSSDPDIAAFAQKTLPTLQHHLSMAQDLKKTIN